MTSEEKTQERILRKQHQAFAAGDYGLSHDTLMAIIDKLIEDTIRKTHDALVHRPGAESITSEELEHQVYGHNLGIERAYDWLKMHTQVTCNGGVKRISGDADMLEEFLKNLKL